MSGSIITFPGAQTSRRPASAAIREHLVRLAGFAIQEWRLRRDLATLQSLDARGLHDIGLTRGSLEGAVRHGRRFPALVGGSPMKISASPEWPQIPSSWTEWR